MTGPGKEKAHRHMTESDPTFMLFLVPDANAKSTLSHFHFDGNPPLLSASFTLALVAAFSFLAACGASVIIINFEGETLMEQYNIMPGFLAWITSLLFYQLLEPSSYFPC